MWRDIAYSMGHISKRSITNDPDSAKLVKTEKLRESHLELEGPAEKLRMLKENSDECTNAGSLDITHGSMASRTAEGVYGTLVRAQSFLLEYFNYIGCDELLEHVFVKMLNDSLAESFFGHMSEIICWQQLDLSSNGTVNFQRGLSLPFGCTHFC